MAWTVRATAEALLAWFVARKLWNAGPAETGWTAKWLTVTLFLAICWMLDSAIRDASLTNAAIFLPVMALQLAWQWRTLLTPEERSAVRERLRLSAADKQGKNVNL